VRLWFDVNIPPSHRAAPGRTWRHENGEPGASLKAEIAAEVPKTAMVLAAGLGKRMRPLTASRPKPLIEVAGKPLSTTSWKGCTRPASRRIVVNVHYLADALEAHFKEPARPRHRPVSDERKLLLETGGGIVQAAPLIESDPFLVVNSDNLWLDGPADTLKLLASHWDAGRMDALLLLVPHARAENHGGLGDFHMDRTGRLRRRERSRVAPFVYTGIQIVSKRLLQGAPEGPFSINRSMGPGDRGGPLLRRRPPGTCGSTSERRSPSGRRSRP
jgi:N-acetyl-alpha-D-muramate 1-phosphate uridylyltransferase